jgi:hypothetical protein
MAKQPTLPEPTPMEGSEPEPGAASPEVAAAATAARMSMLTVMREKFAVEKRVRVKVKSHNAQPVPVQVNGYTFLIQPDKWVEVPESVADLLDQAGYI